MKYRPMIKATLMIIPLLALAATGCHHHGGSGYYSSGTYYSGTGKSDESVTPTTRDAGPGTPIGDATSADTSETSSQGAGGRALVAGGTASTYSTEKTYKTQPNYSYNNNQYSQSSATTANQGDVVIPLYKESFAVGKREVDAGAIRLRKTVKTETVNQPIELRTETVTIDRLPPGAATANQTQGKAFQDQEMIVQLRREEPVVQTQIVPNGEVVARKQFQMQQTNFQGQVRWEDVTVDKGNAQNVNISPNFHNRATGGGAEVGGSFKGSGSSREHGTITDCNVLLSNPNSTEFEGRKVKFTDVKVLAMPDPRLIEIGNDREHPIFVQLRKPANDITEGSTVSLTGKIKTNNRSENLGFNAEATQNFSKQPFFIEAESVKPANH